MVRENGLLGIQLPSNMPATLYKPIKFFLVLNCHNFKILTLQVFLTLRQNGLQKEDEHYGFLVSTYGVSESTVTWDLTRCHGSPTVRKCLVLVESKLRLMSSSHTKHLFRFGIST